MTGPLLIRQADDLGPALRAIRTAAGERLVDTAPRAGMQAAQLSEIERRTVYPGPHVLLRVIAALGYDLALIPRKEPK